MPHLELEPSQPTFIWPTVQSNFRKKAREEDFSRQLLFSFQSTIGIFMAIVLFSSLIF